MYHIHIVLVAWPYITKLDLTGVATECIFVFEEMTNDTCHVALLYKAVPFQLKGYAINLL